MGKKKNKQEQDSIKKKKKEPVVEKFPIDKEVAHFESKYPNIIPFVEPNLIRRLYEESIPTDMRVNGVSWNITTNFEVEKKFFLILSSLIQEGDIDLEIAVIEQFMPIGRMLIRKLGYKGEDTDNKVETAITNAIENYPGKDGFKSAILQELKVIVNGKKEEKSVPVPIVESEKVEDPVIETVIPKAIPESNSEAKTFDREENNVVPVVVEEKKEIILPNDGKLRPPTTLDYLISQIDILKNSPLEDEDYLKFLSLKYGYHNGQFFQLEEICEILSLSKAQVIDYYLSSLQFVKDWFGLQLDHYYTYLKKAND